MECVRKSQVEQSVPLGHMVSRSVGEKPAFQVNTQAEFLEFPWVIEQCSGLVFFPLVCKLYDVTNIVRQSRRETCAYSYHSRMQPLSQAERYIRLFLQKSFDSG